MNPHLQSILDLIEQSAHLSAEEKAALSKAAKSAEKELEITSFKLQRTEKVKHTTAILLEETIAELEQKRKAVEAQNRELEIEAALEKVRSCSLAMHKSEELQDVINTVFDRLGDLGIETNTASIVIYKEGSNEMEQWIQNDERTISTRMIAPFHEKTKLGADLRDSITTRKDLLSALYSKEEKNDWFSFVFEHSDFKRTSDARKKFVLDAESYCISIAAIRNGAVCLGKYSNQPFSENENDILKRFARVFEQAYIRFLDLQKAEAQAREAQIEAALEKVRSRSLAMHHSEELKEVVAIVFEKFHELNFQADGGVGLTIFNDETKGIDYWAANPDYISATCFPTPYFDHVINNDIWKIRERGGDFHFKTYSFEQKNSFWDYLIEHTDFRNLPKENKTMIYESKRMTNAFAFSKHSAIGVITYLEKPFTVEQIEIIKRFARVFEQAYTRFLDLQKAEAQAREAQIELGLERVRARAMAMQRSDELKDLISTVSVEINKLDIFLDRCLIVIYDLATLDATWWMANHEDPGEPVGLFVKYHEHPPYLAHLQAWKERQQKWEYLLEGETKKTWDKFLFSETELSQLPQEASSFMRGLKRVFLSSSFNNFGYLQFATLEPLKDDQFDILYRFGRVIDLTYTRFNDLQKAEAQAREAQIEAALERVRSRTMGMQRSAELSEVAVLLFQQVRSFGIQSWGCGFNIWEKDEKVCTSYFSDPEGNLAAPFTIPLTEDPVFIRFYESRQNGEDFWVKEISGQEEQEHYKYLCSLPVIGEMLNEVLAKGISLPTYQIDHGVNFSNGNLLFITYEPVPEAHDIFKRFGKVFEQTYTRFLDLKKAEAQVKESQIQLALERVRARTMAMHHSDELREVVYVLYDQLMQLGFIHGAANIVLIKADTGDTQWWFTGFGRDEFPDSYFVNYFDHPAFNEMLRRWKSKEKFARILVSGESKVKFDKNFLFESDFKRAPEEIRLKMASLESVEFSMAYMKYGAINLGPEAISDEQTKVLQRFATVFEQTYTRFLDLQKAEARQENHRFSLPLKEFVQEPWACMRAGNWLKWPACFLNR